MEELETIETNISRARVNSMAKELDGITVDFPAQLRILFKEGDRLLRYLANLTGVGIGYNRYSTKRSQAHFAPR